MRVFLRINLAALLASASHVACAQTASSPEPASTPAQDSAKIDQRIADIVVTANRREESLQDVPVAVTAISAEDLTAANVNGIRQLTAVVPGFFGGRNFAGNQPTIRGVTTTFNGPGDESNVALYVDGVYQPEAKSNNIDLVEVSRVEVLRGPQGTIFGRNATGGLINIITPDPRFDARGRIDLGYGLLETHGGSLTAKAYVTGPVVSDKVAADFAVSYRENDGYLRDLVRGGYLGDSSAINLRSKLLFQPSDSAKIILTVAYTHTNETEGNSSQPINGTGIVYRLNPAAPRPDEPWEVALNVRPKISLDNFTASLRTQFNLGGVNLETTTGYGEYHTFQESDSDATPLTGATSHVDFYTTAINQEIRLLSDSNGPFKWIAGVYGFHARNHTPTYQITGAAPTFVTQVRTDLLPRQHTTAFAGFAEGTYKLTDALELTGGIRYSTEKRDFELRINNNLVVPRQEAKSSKVTYRGILNYALAPQANIYVSYSTGFKSGIYNSFGTALTPTRPETISAIEGGLKADPLPWLRTNLSVFHYDYNDLQVTARLPNSVFSALQNAAQARVKGAEVEIQAALSGGLNLKFAGSYLDAKYKSFPGAVVLLPTGAGGNVSSAIDASGNHMIQSPRYSLYFGSDWTHDFAGGRLMLSGNLYHSARVYYEFANRLSQAPYTRVNAEIAWTSSNEMWRLRAFSTNLTNAKIYQLALPSTYSDYATYERPREVGIGVQLKF